MGLLILAGGPTVGTEECIGHGAVLKKKNHIGDTSNAVNSDDSEENFKMTSELLLYQLKSENCVASGAVSGNGPGPDQIGCQS